MAAINVNVDDDLKARLDRECEIQRRTIRAIVEIALEDYFASLDEEAEPAGAVA